MSRSIKATANKILAEMIDKPGEEKTTAGGLILKKKMLRKQQLDHVGLKYTVSGQKLTGLKKVNMLWLHMDVGAMD